MNSPPTVLLSFDVEDWFQVENLRSSFPPECWDDQELRVGISTKIILDILSTFRVPATFFVLGWVAERCPEIVESIVQAGHEVASHGYGHEMPIHLTLEEFRRDLGKAKEILITLTKQPVLGYRAPSYGIDNERLKLLFEEGYLYDSSSHPFDIHNRYGKLSEFETVIKPGLLEHPGGGYEFELPVAKFGPLRFPVSGGGWFRLLPGMLFRSQANRIANSWGHYLIYLHPWEFDVGQPRAKEVSWISYFRHYNNLSRTEPRLKTLIRSFQRRNARFLKMSEYLEIATSDSREPDKRQH